MVGNLGTKIWVLALLGLVAAAFLFIGGAKPNNAAAGGGAAGTPGTTVVPLLSCPNVDASANNTVTVGDILGVVQSYFHDWPYTNYYPLNDLTNPYNPTTGLGGQERVDDILAVVNRYFEVCPAVDTQVAKAARWAIANAPMTENAVALSALGYVRGSNDTPGQGVHYVKYANWDGTFDPAAPEGLVYNAKDLEGSSLNPISCTDGIDNPPTNGMIDGADPNCMHRLAAELYVVSGDNIGWVEDPEPNQGFPTYAPNASSGPCWDGIDNGSDGLTDAADPDCGSGAPAGGAIPGPSDVNIDALCSSAPCSWIGTEGWHLHYRLCTIHIDTPYAVAVPLQDQGTSFNYSAQCDTYQNVVNCPGNSPPCGGLGTHTYQHRVGWMGHLWSFWPNDNQVPDVNATMNGRFADCFPDQDGWTAYDCPR